MPRVIDCHVHLYPREVSADPRGWGEAHGEQWWVQCVDPPGRRTLQGWADATQMVNDMDRDGIEQAILLGWYWEHEETCAVQNGWHLDAIRAYPDRLLAFAAIQPRSGQRGLDEARRCLDAGFVGLGELLPSAQSFSFDDENWARVVALAAEYRVPINLHVTNPLIVTAGSTSKPTPLEDFVRLVRRFPEATFILAHWGGGIPLFFDTNPRLKQCFQNVYFDTSASSLTYQPNVFRRMVDLAGPDRILFGTDYPLLCYPRETRAPGFSRALADAVSGGLTHGESEQVLTTNILGLLSRTVPKQPLPAADSRLL